MAAPDGRFQLGIVRNGLLRMNGDSSMTAANCSRCGQALPVSGDCSCLSSQTLSQQKHAPAAPTPPSAAGSTRQNTAWTSSPIYWALVIGTATFLLRYLPPKPGTPEGNREQAEKRREVISEATAAYWAETAAKAFAEAKRPIDPTQPLSAAFDQELAAAHARHAQIWRHKTDDVDPELITVVAEWIAVEQRLLEWCQNNKALLLENAQGASVAELNSLGVSFLDIAPLIPSDGPSPEILEVRQIALDLDSAYKQLEAMQIRLSERYRDRTFSFASD